MREKILILLLISVFSLGFLLANVYAAEPISKNMEMYQVSKLLSEYVEDSEGGILGRVTDFLADSDGHIEFAVVEMGFLEIGRESVAVAVPLSALSRREGKHYVVNMTRERLASAPRFDAGKDLSNRAFAESVYRYFGLEPSWTEGGQERGIRSDQIPFDLVGKGDTSPSGNGESAE